VFPRRMPESKRQYTRKIPSVVALRQHPIHPMLVVFPIAFLLSLPAADVAFVVLGDVRWAQLGLVLSIAGLSMGLLAAAFGFGDFMLVPEVRNHLAVWAHAMSAVMLLALAAAGVWLRWPDPVAAVWPWGLLLSSVTGGMVMLTGWLGGTLSFRHGIGVYGDRHAQPPAPEQGAAEE
jgi:uncharacterized membrane protein